MLGNRKLGILTASKALLDDSFMEAAGATKAMNVAVQGIEESAEFYATHMGGTRIEMDVEKLRAEIVGIAKRFAEAHPDMAGMLIECSNLPTFSADIQRATGLPVFDYFTFVKFVEASIVHAPFGGFL
jgi:N-acetylglutamate synthase/N-acetylornithine aminotransferase